MRRTGASSFIGYLTTPAVGKGPGRGRSSEPGQELIKTLKWTYSGVKLAQLTQ